MSQQMSNQTPWITEERANDFRAPLTLTVIYVTRSSSMHVADTKYVDPYAGNTLLQRLEGGKSGRRFGDVQDVFAQAVL